MNDFVAIPVLNGLIRACRDAENGYLTAAQRVDSASLKRIFENLAAERAQFADTLAGHVLRFEGVPEDSGTILGRLHRGWLDLRALVNPDEAGILSECERGERHTLALYEKALENPLPEWLRSVLRKQFESIRTTYDDMLLRHTT